MDDVTETGRKRFVKNLSNEILSVTNLEKTNHETQIYRSQSYINGMAVQIRE